MLLARPEVDGTHTIGSGPDGIPIPSGDDLDVCENCWGPIVSHEWFIRIAPSYSGEACTVVAVESIWDKMPCRGCKEGVAHTEISQTAMNTNNTTWQSIVKRNPHRYHLSIGVIVTSNAQPSMTVVDG